MSERKRVIRDALRRWLAQRLPASDVQPLTQRNIYIVPTLAGLVFALTLLVMLIAAINYQLNLGYLLTFLLAGSALVSMHLTHAGLRGLTLHLRAPAPVFAGEQALVEVVLDNPGHERHGLALSFRDVAAAHGGSAWCDVPALGQATVRLGVVPAARGWHTLPPVTVETVFPFGLFRAWTVWRPASRLLAWPRPEQPAPPLPPAAAVQGEPHATAREAGHDLDGLRAWRRGDALRQVAWKKVAATGQLVSRETQAAGSRELWLDWSATAAADTEQRLSRLAAWVQAAERSGLAWGLRLPGLELPPGQGDAQRRAALDHLATYR